METEKLDYLHQRLGGQCKSGDVAPYMFVPGSTERAIQIASAWDSYRPVAKHYELSLFSGLMGSTAMSACATGIGGRSTSIAVDELSALGAHTFLRVGVTGSIQRSVEVGDLIIAAGAVRMDKTSEHYACIEYPAVADFEVVSALIAAAQQHGYRYHVGISATSSSFYCGEGHSGFHDYRHSAMDHIVPDLRAAGVLDWDTETATLFTLCSLYGLRAGRINAVVDNPETGLFDASGEVKAVQTALTAMKILAAWDVKKKISGMRYSLPPVKS